MVPRSRADKPIARLPLTLGAFCVLLACTNKTALPVGEIPDSCPAFEGRKTVRSFSLIGHFGFCLPNPAEIDSSGAFELWSSRLPDGDPFLIRVTTPPDSISASLMSHSPDGSEAGCFDCLRIDDYRSESLVIDERNAVIERALFSGTLFHLNRVPAQRIVVKSRDDVWITITMVSEDKRAMSIMTLVRESVRF